jgi:hypothetical protein
LGRCVDTSGFDNQYFPIIFMIDGIDTITIAIVSMSMSQAMISMIRWHHHRVMMILSTMYRWLIPSLKSDTRLLEGWRLSRLRTSRAACEHYKISLGQPFSKHRIKQSFVSFVKMRFNVPSIDYFTKLSRIATTRYKPLCSDAIICIVHSGT